MKRILSLALALLGGALAAENKSKKQEVMKRSYTQRSISATEAP